MLSQEIQWLLEEKYQGQKTDGFLTDVARIEAGEPLAFVIGSIPFLNTTINLDSRPLIPRTETEYWTKLVIEEIKARPKSELRILDICAGSGCIGVAIAHDLPNVLVDFSELESRHVPTIEKNCLENGIANNRYQIFSGNLFAPLFEETPNKYDLIVSNPPYIDPVLDRTESSVKNYEPEAALYGGVEGMEILARLIKEAPGYLKTNGELWVEHEPEQSEAILALAEPIFAVTTQEDQYGIKRFTKLVLQ